MCVQVPRDLVKMQVLSLHVRGWGLSSQADCSWASGFPLRSEALQPHFCQGVPQDCTTSCSEQVGFNPQAVWETLHLAFSLGDSRRPTRISEKLCNKETPQTLCNAALLTQMGPRDPFAEHVELAFLEDVQRNHGAGLWPCGPVA